MKNLLAYDYVLPLADAGAILETVGGKGASLARLVLAGLPVPDGFHITTSAYRCFIAENDLQPHIETALEGVDLNQPQTLENASKAIQARFAETQIPPDVAGAIARAYDELAGSNPVVAVRSSATAEDLPEASFAGQQDSFLNVEGYDEVMAAVKRCWASLWTARAIGYRAQHGISAEGLSLAIVVQALVPAEAAGILFTANPVTGRRDQALISAAWGLGEAIVGGLVTPDSLTVDKAGNTVLEHMIADKQVMTVRFNGGTEERAVPAELRHAPVLDEEAAQQLVYLGEQIEGLYGMPMDIEWAMADGDFAIVQARPITALPEPKVQPPTDWPLPDPKGSYMRGSVVDFVPEPLTPLFASTGIPALNAAMKRTLEKMIGGEASMTSGMFTTINDYAYMHVKLTFRDWLWVLFRMGPATPRLLRNGEPHWREVARPNYAKVVDEWHGRTPAELSATELLAGVDALTNAMADYLTTLQVDSLGSAAGTEGLFTQIYDRLIKREGDPHAATLLLGSDNTPIQAEKALYDLAQWCLEDEDLAAYLLETPPSQIVSELSAGEDQGWPEWQQYFQAYLARYGHSIYSLDFSQPLPADDPRPILETMKLFMRGEGANPHERQRRLIDQREKAVQMALTRVGGLKRRVLRWALRWAQTFTRLREDSIFDIGLGYPVLRQMLGELGRRCTDAGALAGGDDIYWLTRKELQDCAAVLDQGELLQDWSESIRQRKAMWRAQKEVSPPQTLPHKGRVMGIKTDAFMPTSADAQTEDILKGVAASPGQVTATARILLGPEDFSLMKPGDILVAEITTPAWTPLFAMAAGVVTDIGGPLSHGSIVAREYGIPAVLGTGIATQRIVNDQEITVDGSTGTVHISRPAA